MKIDSFKAYEDPSSGRTERIAALQYDYAAQEKSWAANCNLCEAGDWTILTHHDRYGFPAQAVACRICGLTVLNPRMTASAYKYFYEGIYRPLVSAYHGRRIDAQTIKVEQQTYAAEMERLVTPYFTGREGAALLDVGGSTGVVAAHFSRRFNLKGTVLDPAANEIIEAKSLGIETITALIEEWQGDTRRFQVIGMFQTIDHLLDIRAVLGKLRTLISEDGIFVVDVVDFRAAYLKNWSIEMAVKADHPFSLTEQTAEAFLARAGFAILRKAYSADHHLVGYVCRPSTPNSGALPSRESVERFFQEVRFVQNAPRTIRAIA